ncbi:MAG: PIN domain-containing protein [Acidobacteria bacterium]|nr:PIN domain-containing protein [Acidobacteriota bacterium]
MIALDTNLLVYAHRSAVAEHRSAQQAIARARRAAGGWGFSLPVAAEFWSVVTHPAAPGRPSTGSEARRFLAALGAAGAEVWVPGAGFAARLARLADDLAVLGPRIFDLQIALMAFEGGATEVWTTDNRFASVPGLQVVHPFDA